MRGKDKPLSSGSRSWQTHGQTVDRKFAVASWWTLQNTCLCAVSNEVHGCQLLCFPALSEFLKNCSHFLDLFPTPVLPHVCRHLIYYLNSLPTKNSYGDFWSPDQLLINIWVFLFFSTIPPYTYSVISSVGRDLGDQIENKAAMCGNYLLAMEQSNPNLRTNSNNHFIMLTNSMGQEFWHETTKWLISSAA